MFTPERLPKVVVADDSPTMQRLYELYLEHDFEVLGTADNGQDAVALATILRPELVILDVDMPRMNGLEAAALLSQRLPDLEVVLATGEESWELRRRARDAGVAEVLPKPFTRIHLVATLERLVRQRRVPVAKVA